MSFVNILTWFVFVQEFLLLIFLSDWGIRLFLCELSYSSTMPLRLKISYNQNNLRIPAIGCDLEKYETFLLGLYFWFPGLGFGFVFAKGRSLNRIRYVWTQFSVVYLILLPKPLWFHSYLSITLTARQEIVFIIFKHFLQVKIFYQPENWIT